MVETNQKFREMMAYQIYSAMGFLIPPFSLIALYRDQFLLALLPLTTAALCVVNVLHYRRFGHFIVSAYVISLLYILDVLVVIRELGTVGVYWAFPTMIAFYWVHKRRIALGFVSLLFLGMGIGAYFSLTLDATMRMAVTLLITAAFFHMAMTNQEPFIWQ